MVINNFKTYHYYIKKKLKKLLVNYFLIKDNLVNYAFFSKKLYILKSIL
uniref:Uncharacterized protein n=1 Tax=Polysiphonia elongata TaxID=159753 RepID=A0A1Z1MBP8_9FLOR|nr:hypothetical protein [Polysiphonia elongata]ARW63245.1 hypothetical protein [Polysiphonia elongata]